jgi:hypothetical protein
MEIIIPRRSRQHGNRAEFGYEQRDTGVSKAKAKSLARQLEELTAEKSLVLSKAQTFETVGLPGTSQPLWASAASYEERIAALLDAGGDDLEAAVHRISAASCY